MLLRVLQSPWTIGIVITLLILLFAAIVFLILKASLSGKQSAASEDIDHAIKNKRYDSPIQLRGAFHRAIEILKKRVTGRDYRYQVPWYLMVGEKLSGKSTVLANNGLGLPLGDLKNGKPEQDEGLQWWFYDKGVVIEPKGDFVLKTDGKTSNDSAWQTVIKLLKKHRPKRPIDGVILTIPCEDLYWNDSETYEKTEIIKNKSTLIYSKLWDLQNELGIHFPIYVLVTKSDVIPGFSSYAFEMPEYLKDNILGWSNSYSLDTSFSPKWIDEAIDTIHTGIFKTQMALFAAKPEINDPESLYVFPNQFRNVLEPVKTYLGALFKESAFHKTFYFRGLYFTGSPIQTGDSVKTPRFLKHLFEKKVFVENGLARIVDQALLSKHRALRVAQVGFLLVLVVFGGGLLNATLDLRAEKQTMLPVLNLISDSLVELKFKKTVDRSLFEKKGVNLLNGMSEIDPSGLDSIFVPSSWPSDIQSHIVSCMAIAYEKIIMRMMFIELNNRVRTTGFVDNKPIKSDPTPPGEEMTIDKTPEFKHLLSFIKSLEELEKNIAIYNNRLIKKSANSREFVQVVDYLYGIDLTGNISQEALAKLNGMPISTDILKANINAKTWELTRQFYDGVFRHNPLNEKITQVKGILKNIHRDESLGGEKNIVVKFQNMLDMLNQINKDMAKQEYAWIVSPTLDLGPKFEQILDSVQNSGFLGQPVYIELKKRGEKELALLRERLAGHETRLTGPILKKENGRVQLAFSPRMDTLTSALEDFFSMKFADIENARSKMVTDLPNNTRIIWNTQILSQATELYGPYNQFMTEKLNNFPHELQPIFEQVARESLETNMIDQIGRAQEIGAIPEISNPSFRKERLRAEVLNIKEASESIAKLLKIFDVLELHETNRDLFKVVALQGNRVLREIDQLLREDTPYMARDGGFTWWKGDRSPMLTAYNVNDTDELKYYFTTQQERVKFLANEYAIPVVNLVGYRNKNRGYVDVQLVRKWERIISSIDSFEKKKPGNSIDILEKFILTGIDEIATRHCKKEIPSGIIAARSRDFFLQQRNQLRKSLYLQCQKLSFNKEIREF